MSDTPPATAGADPDQITPVAIEDQIKDIRALFFSALLLSAYSILTVSTLTDADYFTSVKLVKLPIIGVEIPLFHFMFVAPVIVFIMFIVYFLMLSRLRANLRREKARGEVEPRFLPIYFRWYALPDREDMRALDHVIDFVAASFLPVLMFATLATFWWEGILLHNNVLSMLLASFVLATALTFIGFSCSYIRRTARRHRRVTIVVTVLLACGLAKATFDLSGMQIFGERWSERYNIFDVRRAELSGVLLTQIDGNYLQRYAWVRRYAGEFFPPDSNPAKAYISPETFENEWRDVRRQALERLRKPDLEAAHFAKADLRSATLVGVNVARANFSQAILAGARMEGARGQFTLFSGADMKRAILQGGQFFKADFREARADWLSIEESDLRNADMIDGQFFGARFDLSNLRGARLAGADLREASFTHANLIDVDFAGADVDGASFDHAYLFGADLSGVKNLSAEQLNTAYLGDDPLLPPSIDLSERKRRLGKRCVRSRQDLKSQNFPYPSQWWMTSDGFQMRALCRNFPKREMASLAETAETAPPPELSPASSTAAGVETDGLAARGPAGEPILHGREGSVDQHAQRGDDDETGEDEWDVEP